MHYVFAQKKVQNFLFFGSVPRHQTFFMADQFRIHAAHFLLCAVKKEEGEGKGDDGKWTFFYDKGSSSSLSSSAAAERRGRPRGLRRSGGQTPKKRYSSTATSLFSFVLRFLQPLTSSAQMKREIFPPYSSSSKRRLRYPRAKVAVGGCSSGWRRRRRKTCTGLDRVSTSILLHTFELIRLGILMKDQAMH